MEQQKSSNPMSSFWPILMIGLAAMLLLQYFQQSKKPAENNAVQTEKYSQTEPGKKEKSPENTSAEKKNESTATPAKAPVSANITGPSDFEFPVTDKETITDIKTSNYIIRMTDRGARVHSLYVVNNKNFSIPDKAIAESKDEYGIQNKAYEISHLNGLDFQPHLYFQDSISGRIWQIKEPILNQGAFR